MTEKRKDNVVVVVVVLVFVTVPVSVGDEAPAATGTGTVADTGEGAAAKASVEETTLCPPDEGGDSSSWDSVGDGGSVVIAMVCFYYYLYCSRSFLPVLASLACCLCVCAFVVGNKTTIYFDVRRSVNRPIPNARRAIRSTCNALKRRLKLIFPKEFLNGA